jgi:anti-sigma factor (TIGR02949 family)
MVGDGNVGYQMKNCQDLEPLLTPYVDGEATADQRAAIEAHLATCPSCRDCADAEAHARDMVKACRDQLVTPAPARLHQKCAQLAREEAAAAAASAPAIGVSAPSSPRASERLAPPVWRRWAPVSLLATAALVVVGVFAYSALSSRGTALAAQLARDHIRCTGIVGDRAPADPVAQREGWVKRLGWSVDIPTFSSGDELQFVQLRRCAHDKNVTMAHILYRRHGRLLSLFVMPEHEPDRSELTVAGERTVIWSQGGRTYAVVGATSSAELQELADRFSRVLPETAAR